jgi:glycosyltransferase involved in cell wall biosynthesis
VHGLGLSGAVRTTLRYVSHCEMAAWFTAADAVALPYLATSQSAVLMTAYTFGRPVVTTTVGGLPEAVDPGQSGLLVPPSDEAALVEAIVALLADSHRCTQMGRYARHLAETRYSWQVISSATLGVYRSLMKAQ